MADYRLTLEKLENRSASIGIIGLGYVGLPLAKAFIHNNYTVIGFDIDQNKIDLLTAGQTYIEHIGTDQIKAMFDTGRLSVTTNFSGISNVDAVIICVPTPLGQDRQPDLGPVLNTGRTIAPYIRAGQIIVLESSTYPGTTDEELAGVLKASGLEKDKDFFLAYSPEREDPGNPDFTTSTIPKVVGADCPEACALAAALYQGVINTVVPVSSTRAAEAVKLTENIFRSVNIALVNELKVIFDAMDIDVWEVIDGAATKPFGFMPFYPGPGLGGHCIPIDPFYLTYKANQYGVETRFIELAGEINTQMPGYVIGKTKAALGVGADGSLSGKTLLVLGLSYKRDVDDMRESPSLVIMDALIKSGAQVDYHDPHVPVLKMTRAHPHLAGQKSIALTADAIGAYDGIIICTDHRAVDYDFLAQHARLIIDTRNIMKDRKISGELIKA